MAKKILIADDDEDIVELLKAAFEMAGFSVVYTTLGYRLPQMVEAEKPDLLVLDLLLPGLDGYSLQLQFSQNEATKNMPVIVITALPAARSLFEKFEQVKLFLGKPFETEVIVEKAKKILGT